MRRTTLLGVRKGGTPLSRWATLPSRAEDVRLSTAALGWMLSRRSRAACASLRWRPLSRGVQCCRGQCRRRRRRALRPTRLPSRTAASPAAIFESIHLCNHEASDTGGHLPGGGCQGQLLCSAPGVPAGYLPPTLSAAVPLWCRLASPSLGWRARPGCSYMEQSGASHGLRHAAFQPQLTHFLGPLHALSFLTRRRCYIMQPPRPANRRSCGSRLLKPAGGADTPSLHRI